jgi:DNA-binding NarL/FixJ family response regulator
VILELGLPDASGFEVLTRLVPVARHPEIPVIVLTQFTHEALLEVAKINGAFGVLQKHTTSGDELAIAVHKALTTGQPADSSHFDHSRPAMDDDGDRSEVGPKRRRRTRSFARRLRARHRSVMVIVSMSSGKRTRFLIRCLPATAVQTCEHGDRQPGVQVHCPFR